jgi:Uma2 family endonuclease
MKREITKIDFTSDEDYFLFEEKSEVRHELINGSLYKMSGISRFHSKMVYRFLLLLGKFIDESEYLVVFESYKVRTPDGNYFYPDVTVCEKNAKRYYAEKPILMVEVLYESTRKFNLADQFIQYQKPETLQYYLCVEPEQQMVIFYHKTEDGEWITDAFTGDNDTIDLKKLQLSFTLKDIYKPA